MATTNGSLISVEDVTVRFGGVIAVNRASMAVPAGEIRGLIGPNGAGKTTLFDTITGMRPPSSGTVHFDGTDITSRSAVWRSRNGIRRTFQRQQPFGWLTVEDNVLVALDYHGGGGGLIADLVAFPARKRIEAERRTRARAVVEQCGLGDVAQDPAGSLPIGKIRLLELARAIVDRPRALLLDEPTSGLEEHESRRLAQIVRDFRDSTGAAVLLVEHDVPFVMDLSDRVTVLNLGEVIAEGSPDDVSRNPAVRAAYLG
ncbi:MAG TPA: ABC transporter ATP-binding protein [Acidimicrobiales bacterium]|nr:ABC transporter ATP-binding protein [Acidimicrobiales bacterium]